MGIGLWKGRKNKRGFCFWDHSAQTEQGVVSVPRPEAAGDAAALPPAAPRLRPGEGKRLCATRAYEKMCGISLGFLVQELKEF